MGSTPVGSSKIYVTFTVRMVNPNHIFISKKVDASVVAKTEFIHTPTIENNLNSQIHLVSTSELIENDSLNRKITQAINKSVKITEYQTMNCLSFCVKTYIM